MKYIFEIRIKEGYSAEQYADVWVKASELIQQAPGALGTELHRKIGDPDRLIAIAHWESPEARDAMATRHDATVAEIISRAAPYVDIHTLGSFEDPEWVVMPTDYKEK